MNRREAIEATARENALLNAGISREDAEALRRISMTLHRWHEKECGIDSGCSERDETTGKTFWLSSHSGRRWPIADRETGARKRLAAIMARYERSHSCGYFGPCTTCPTCVQPTTLGLRAYVQGDPRGCALYILRPGDAPVGQEDSHYSRGLAVY